MTDEDISNLIRRHAQRHHASAQLRAAVQTQITLHAAGRKSRFADLFGIKRFTQMGLGFAVGVVLTLALVWTVPRMLAPAAVPDALVGELLSLHVRSIGTGPLFQVASSDRHTVKPWFQGKLDYAPEVPDLHEGGFELLGGRIDRVHGHDTAVMSYQLRKHIISAYVSPWDQVLHLERLQHRGFNVVHWSDGVMQVWAVTDADVSELERFGSAWQSKVAFQTPQLPP